MCVIVYSPHGAKLPSIDTFRSCFDRNSNGCGFMYPFRDRVIVQKGFMKFNAFEKRLDNVRNIICDSDGTLNTPFVAHFRIATSGGISESKCHPFPITDNVHLLNHGNVSCDYGVAHNGIVSSGNKKLSDTQCFIIDILYPLARKGLIFDKTVTELIAMTHSKFVIMDHHGKCSMIGDFEKDGDSYFSNSLYKSVKSIGYDWSSMNGYRGENSWDSYSYNGYSSGRLSYTLTSHIEQYKTLHGMERGVCPGCNLSTHSFGIADKKISNSYFDYVVWKCNHCGHSWVSVYPSNHPQYKRYNIGLGKNIVHQDNVHDSVQRFHGTME